MLSGCDIVCFSANRWDDIWRNRHQIMSRMARRNRVLFVEPSLYLSQLSANLKQQGPGVLQGSRLYSPLENLWVYQWPEYAPQSGRAPLRQATFALRKRSLQHALQHLGMSNPILWIFLYNLGEMIGHLDERLVIYHAVDEYSAYSPKHDNPGRVQVIKRMEAEVMERSDLVFVVSPALYESKKHLHPHVVLVPNGVDYDLFSDPRFDDERPADLAGVSHPLLIFAGVINEKIDLQLLLAVARQRPQWQLALVGPVLLRQGTETVVELQKQVNVHWLGSKRVEELPAYMHAADVCLMPYQLNEWTRNISPLKLYEYLATGVPIVSTDIPAVEEFADVVWRGSGPDGFIAAIAQALAADSPERRRRQQMLAKDHSWDQRVEALSAAIEQRL